MKQDMIVILDWEAMRTQCLPGRFVRWEYIAKSTRTTLLPPN